MALKTGAEYIESLRDGRVVWLEGQRVADVTTYPHIRASVESTAMDYIICHDPRHRDLFVDHDESGEPFNFHFKVPRNAADLLRRQRMIQTVSRTCFGLGGGGKLVGIDALHGLGVACASVDRAQGTDYSQRVAAFYKYCRDTDAALSAAVTDVKGDRSLRPSKQRPHRDYYVRIVDESKDGIVVRGAKAHISLSPVANEVIVMPCRAMTEADKEYAVIFAIPPDTKGLTFILPTAEGVDDDDWFEYPLAAHHYRSDAMLIFDDVFVPNERIFLKGEWQYSNEATYTFADFHRVSDPTFKAAELEIVVGAAALMAEYHGLDRVSHIRDKISWLVYYAETLGALVKTACENCAVDPGSGIAYPNPMIANAAKFFDADNWHQALKLLIDITGGIVATAPSSKDFLNPETHGYLDKYLGGKEGVPTEHKLRVIKLVKDLSCAFYQGRTLHGGGSLAAQKLSFYSLADFESYKAAARRVSGIEATAAHPVYGQLPDFPSGITRQ